MSGTGGACDVEMGERNGGVGDGEEERRNRRGLGIGRTGAQKNRLPSRAACSFLSSEFSSAGIFRGPRRWLSAGDGSMLFGNGRICTVSALVWGGAVLLLERAALANGQISVMPIPGRLASCCLLSWRCLVGSRTVHKGITACARPGRPREIPVPGFSFWRPGG